MQVDSNVLGDDGVSGEVKPGAQTFQVVDQSRRLLLKDQSPQVKSPQTLPQGKASDLGAIVAEETTLRENLHRPMQQNREADKVVDKARECKRI